MDRSVRYGALLGLSAGAAIGVVIGFFGFGRELSFWFVSFGLASTISGALIGALYSYFRGR